MALAMNMVDTKVKKDHQVYQNDVYKKSLMEMSRIIYCYQGYSGLGQPWHDAPDPIWRYSAKTVSGLIEYLDREDITLESYAIFSFPLVDYSKYAKLGTVISAAGHRSWLKKLRGYAGSADLMDEAADLLLQFFQCQVERDGKAQLKAGSIVKKDLEITNSGKYCEGYHRLIDRIRQLKELGVDPEIWMREKVRKCTEAFPDSPLLFRTIVNVNAFDPNIVELKAYSNDTWREIRTFLGLSQDCEFIDGSIPKGWGPSGDDRDELKNIARIDKAGYYWYYDGTQRRGKYHYGRNSHWVISCTPDNFSEFKGEWLDLRLLVKTPTWLEYKKWGAYPNIWGEDGKPLNNRGRSVKWRSNGRKKR